MPTIASIDKLFSQAVESKAMPGIVAVAARDKETVYEGAFGKRELGKDAPMTVDSVVWIASMTKAITGTAAMQSGRTGQAQSRATGQRRGPRSIVRQDARGRERPEARPLFPGQHLRPARHEGHVVQALALPARAARQRAPARRSGRARADRIRPAGGPRVPHGRRRPLRHRPRLPDLH